MVEVVVGFGMSRINGIELDGLLTVLLLVAEGVRRFTLGDSHLKRIESTIVDLSFDSDIFRLSFPLLVDDDFHVLMCLVGLESVEIGRHNGSG